MLAFGRILSLGFLAAILLTRAWSQDADLQRLNALAADFESHVKVRGIPEAAFLPPPKIRLYTAPQISFYDPQTATSTEARFSELPAPVQENFNHWAAFASEPSGEAFFRNAFYRFFFIHELGHWLQDRVWQARKQNSENPLGANADYYQGEIQSNRIAVAWYREHDPEYLSRFVAELRAIEAHLPNPVPAGRDKLQYFLENYAKLETDPAAYGWYQIDLVITAYEQPRESFQQVLDALPTVTYKRAAKDGL